MKIYLKAPEGIAYTGRSAHELAKFLSEKYDLPYQQVFNKAASNGLKRVPHGFRRVDITPPAQRAPAYRGKGKTGGVTLAQAVKGAEAVLNLVRGGHIKQNLITSRSRTCDKCPMKTKVSYCASCNFAGKVATLTRGMFRKLGYGYKLTSDAQSSYCKACKCSLAVMLPTPISMFNHDQYERHESCWIIKELQDAANQTETES